MQNSKILLLGGGGFLGSHLAPLLQENYDVIIPMSADFNLTEQDNVRRVLWRNNPDIVANLAAYCGGIELNRKHPGKMFYDNAIMGIMLMHEAKEAGVKKFIQVGTVCAYPRITPVPFQEKNLWKDLPEPTNLAYGMAKKILLIQAQAYRQEYGFNAIYLIPVNLYGENDSFVDDKSHVIPALIKRFINAKEKNLPSVTIWGTGNPTREFLYVGDAARAIVMAMERYDGAEPINIGAGKEISIRDLANLIKEEVGYGGDIVFDPSKPDGQPRRCLDTTKAKELFGFEAKTDFREGLRKTIGWYKKSIGL